jgi:hypothetical protein
MKKGFIAKTFQERKCTVTKYLNADNSVAEALQIITIGKFRNC